MTGWTDLEGLDDEEEQELAEEYRSDVTAVERLEEVAEEVLEEERYHGSGIDRKIYDRLYEDVEDRLSGVEYTAEDVEGFVLGRINHEYGEKRSWVLGAYTGALAELVTRRNNRRGRSTSIEVNGGGGRFPHLFTCAQELDELVVENVEGRELLANIAFSGGYARRVVGRELEGVGIANQVAGRNGGVEELVLEGVTGRALADSVARAGGRIERLAFQDVLNDHIGKRMAAARGRIDVALFEDIRSVGSSASYAALVGGIGGGARKQSEESDVGLLVCRSIEGAVGRDGKTFDWDVSSKVEYVVVEDVEEVRYDTDIIRPGDTEFTAIQEAFETTDGSPEEKVRVLEEVYEMLSGGDEDE